MPARHHLTNCRGTQDTATGLRGLATIQGECGGVVSGHAQTVGKTSAGPNIEVERRGRHGSEILHNTDSRSNARPALARQFSPRYDAAQRGAWTMKKALK